ncbi:PREDICTED: uncharacterized protein LOC107326980 [Acropora digitifera]|uniref:uncharacterized protein LOC107326980 n=1 Tax=Acropora digitifera TaxID=70779 RepID=UPI00077B1A78|nr:PREDICTED: uncharacterized protein LOC107326980 [Acropora digitifera]
MDSEKPNFHTTKLLTTWWDLIDHYVLAVMLTVSVASVGLQTTQDRLICIPAVRCSDFASNDSVVRRWSDFSDVSDSCKQSASLVVLTKMSDRRQYDYVDNECYGKMHLFSAYYSLFFLAEAVLLLAISNFWQKYPNSASALGHCEHLLLEFTKGDILVPKDKEGQQQIQEQQQQQTEQKQAEQKLLQRLLVFKERYSQKITSKFNCSSVTGQYRFRSVGGIIVTIAALLVNAIFYSALSTGFTQCHLDGHVAFSIKHRLFQCTRSMGSYFKVASILLFILLGLHFSFVFYSFVWSLSGERCGPVYTITPDEKRTSDEDAASPSEGCRLLPCYGVPASSSGQKSTPEKSPLLEYKGDAAFLFHFIHKSNSSFLITVIRYLLKEQEEKERRA